MGISILISPASLGNDMLCEHMTVVETLVWQTEKSAEHSAAASRACLQRDLEDTPNYDIKAENFLSTECLQ